MNAGGTPSDGVRLGRLVDLEADGADGNALIAGMIEIFRATAAKWPADPDAARAFQDLWFGQYIVHERDLVFLGTEARTGAVAGYLVGCRIDPAQSPRFASLAYFKVFASLCERYPAHLHINIADGFRSRGLGARLIDAFRSILAAEKIGGMHVVTARDQRNLAFYKKLGFQELASTPRGTTDVLFLARSTTAA